jgi:branched-chain amino acid transport system permease protein
MLFHQINKIKMHFEVVPQVLKHNTLFIHGNLASNFWWQPTLEVLKANSSGGGHAYLAEWRGCGKSSREITESELDMELIADHYIQMVLDLALGSVDAVGHSTGGLIALLAAKKAPQLFRKIVLLDPVAPKGFILSPELTAAFEQMQKDHSLCRTVMATTIHQVQTDTAFFKKIVDDAFSVSPAVWLGVPRALQKINNLQSFSQITHSVLLLHGELDPVLPVADSRELAAVLPHCQFKEIPQAGHSLNIERPEIFVAELSAHFY